MEQIIIAIVILAIVLFIRRREAFVLRWEPTRHTWIAVGTAVLATLLSAAMLLFETGSVPASLLHYGGIYILCGAAIPWGYTLLVERGSPADLGITRERWRASLLVSLVLTALFSLIIILEGDPAAMHWGQFARAAVVLVGAGGLFELFLYYGFVHLRLERAFGPLPAILLTAPLYVLWHVGTQLPLEPDVPAAILKLLGVGVMYQAVFSLTRNALIIWPLFHGVGVMIDFSINLEKVGLVSQRVPWALGAMAGMAMVILVCFLALPLRQPDVEARQHVR